MALQTLNCARNQLTALSKLDACTALEGLFCTHNQLTAIPTLDACVAFQNLHCSNNQLTALHALNTCVALRSLFCDDIGHQNPPPAAAPAPTITTAFKRTQLENTDRFSQITLDDDETDSADLKKPKIND